MKSFRNHIDPEKEEQLQSAKIEVQNKVKKILKLAKGINGNKDGNLKKKSEIIHLIEDFQQHYESLYSQYDDLRGKVKNNIRDGGSSSPSDSESYYSPVETTPKRSSNESTSSILQSDHDNQDYSGTSDVEDTTILKDKLTSSSEVKETTQNWARVKELELELALLKLETEALSSLKQHCEKEAVEMNEKRSSLEGRVADLEGACDALNAEKEEMEARLKDVTERVELELELNKKRMEENLELQRKISQLQTSLLEREKETSAHEKRYNEVCGKMKNLESRVEVVQNERDSLQVELEDLKGEKKRWLTAIETEKQELMISKCRTERKNTELTNKIADQQKTLLELGDAVTKLKSDNEKALAQARFLDSKPNFQVLERKVEEMAEDLRKQFEDKYRLLSRRIRVAEQLHVETKELHRRTKEVHEHEKKEMEEAVENIKESSVMAGEMMVALESMSLRLEECNANFLNRISKASCELKFAKEWAGRKNTALRHVKQDLEGVLVQLDHKEAEILAYREKVWRWEHKTRELEKMMKKKEDGMLGLQEEKREAIRQLCVWIDYHRSRSDFYMKMLFDINERRRNQS